MAVCVIILVIVIGCSDSETHPLYPSYAELTQRGFYVYVLPESEVKQRGWSQTVWIYSWDQHCKNMEPSASPNPISVSYLGPAENEGVGILISPWSIAWDHGEPSTEMKLETPWAGYGVAEYYTSGNYNSLQFEDRFGISVEVSSRLPVTEVILLINQMEYIGPPPETVTNPWDYSKCPDR